MPTDELFTPPSSGAEGAQERAEGRGRCKPVTESLPYPTTADGKNPWPRIWAERAAAGELVPSEWRAAVTELTGKEPGIGDEIY